jgi:hypothetical protein
MTVKEHAQYLYSYYDNLLNKDFSNPIIHDNQIKQCAIAAVDFAMNSEYKYYAKTNLWICGTAHYEKIKQEIENL